ncbi:retrovirus-related pol polyprotein from transposon TNT 1-94 [Tanacetum coccineum]
MFTKNVRGIVSPIVSQTCPNSPKPSEKLVVVTPMNKDKRVRFAEPVTSSSNIPKQTDSLKTKDSNKPLLTSTGVKPTTSASGSKPSGNTKNNRITRPPSSNQKNKVEDHSRKFESICAICNKCLFDANHDMCIIDYVNDVNKPTGRTFTIVGNRCPLTRITSTKVVPPKETTSAPVVTPTSGILVYSRRPKATRSVGSSSKVKIVESKTSNSKEPKQFWGSIISDVPSSSLNDCRFGNDHIAKIMGYGDYQMGNVTISWVYYVEGLDFIIKFLNMIQVRLNATVRNIRIDNGTEFVNQTLKAYYEEVGISHQTSFARTSQQNCVVKKWNRTLVEVAQTMLIFLKALLFLWTEAVATACYIQNRSLIRKLTTKHHMNFSMIKNLTYPIFTSLVLSAILLMTLKIVYLNPPPSVDLQVPIVIAPEPPVSTVIPLSVEEADHDIKVAHMDNNPSVKFPIPEPSSEESSTQVVIPNHVHSINQPPKHINKWTKDHPIDNVIGEAPFYYFDAFLSSVEPKSYKDALTESCWIEAMQEEPNEFEHIEV